MYYVCLQLVAQGTLYVTYISPPRTYQPADRCSAQRDESDDKRCALFFFSCSVAPDQNVDVLCWWTWTTTYTHTTYVTRHLSRVKAIQHSIIGWWPTVRRCMPPALSIRLGPATITGTFHWHTHTQIHWRTKQIHSLYITTHSAVDLVFLLFKCII